MQLISTIAIGGSITAFFCFSFLVRRLKLRMVETLVHFSFILLSLSFFFLDKSTPGIAVIGGILLFIYNFCAATFLCLNSIEMMSLARPGNETMACAFCQTYQNTGISLGRLGASLALGAGMLADSWENNGMVFSNCQSIFLCCSVILATVLLLLPHLPSFVRKHEDYYNPCE